jgi:(2R)-ethylmalonyl-CoA mutase
MLHCNKICFTPEGIAAAAADKRAHIVGLSMLSGSHLALSHLALVADVIARLKEAGAKEVPVVVGGIIPPQDAAALKRAGVAGVCTPKDFELNRIMSDLCRIAENSAAEADAAE